MATISEEELYQFHRAQREAERRARYGQPDPRRRLSRTIERDVAFRLAKMGYRVRRQGHNARYDLLIEDCLRVEVKAAYWYRSSKGRGRYQAHLHNRADVIVFGCVNGSNHYFVIPTGDVQGRKNIAIWSYHPSEYGGQWAEYLEAWANLELAVELTRGRTTYQLSFEEAGDEDHRDRS